VADEQRQGEQDGLQGVRGGHAARLSLEAIDDELEALARAVGLWPAPPPSRFTLAELEAELEQLARALWPSPASVRPTEPPIAPLETCTARPLSLPPAPMDYVGLPAVLSLLDSDGEIRSAITPPPPAPEADTVPPLEPLLAMREPTPIPDEPVDADAVEAAFAPIPAAPRLPRADVTAGLMDVEELPDLDLEMEEPAAHAPSLLPKEDVDLELPALELELEDDDDAVTTPPAPV
jgi:hypothetical protein